MEAVLAGIKQQLSQLNAQVDSLSQVVQTSSQHREQRARLCEELSPLDKDDVLDAIFSYEGFGDYIYTGAVSRRWNGRYIKLCYNKAAEVGQKDKLCTLYKSVIITAARFQVAMDCGCDVAAMQKCTILSAAYVVLRSLETKSVLTLNKRYDYKWNDQLTYYACSKRDLQLLKWLHAHRCPIDVEKSSFQSMYHENIEMLEFLRCATPQWSYKHLQRLLYVAGRFDHMKSANWLHSIDAPWPDSFYLASDEGFRVVSECWHPDVV
eukprot:5189-Heterococcus_DN1.PRE.1